VIEAQGHSEHKQADIEVPTQYIQAHQKGDYIVLQLAAGEVEDEEYRRHQEQRQFVVVRD